MTLPGSGDEHRLHLARRVMEELGYGHLTLDAGGADEEIAILSAPALELGAEQVAAIAAALRPLGFRYVAANMEDEHRGS